MNQAVTKNLPLSPNPERLEIISSAPGNIAPMNWEQIGREAFLLNNQVQLNKDGKISTHILFTCIPKGLLEERYKQKQQQKTNYMNP
ncbi:hypothetical protein HWI79_117 [Cryptosporidium felis]|nr:hypothetical protein HWI79_117 [Cryptosporidium felis]